MKSRGIFATTFRRGRRARIFAVAVLAVVGVALTLVASGTAVRQPRGPQLKVEPWITGATIVGQRLTANRGRWSGAGTIGYKYQWLRCNQNSVDDWFPAGCKNILGATQHVHVLGNADLNRRLRLRIKASNNQGTNEATSAPTSVVQSPGGPPAAERPPFMSGLPFVGYTLKAYAGSWVGSKPITFSYRWLSCDKDGNACKQVPAEENATYKLVKKDVGRTFRLREIAKNGHGTNDAFSSPRGPVIVF